MYKKMYPNARITNKRTPDFPRAFNVYTHTYNIFFRLIYNRIFSIYGVELLVQHVLLFGARRAPHNRNERFVLLAALHDANAGSRSLCSNRLPTQRRHRIQMYVYIGIYKYATCRRRACVCVCVRGPGSPAVAIRTLCTLVKVDTFAHARPSDLCVCDFIVYLYNIYTYIYKYIECTHKTHIYVCIL